MQLEGVEEQSESLEHMLGKLADDLQPEKLSELKEAVYSREDTASTYLEDGLAVPHGRVNGLDKEYIVVGISRKGIDWPSDDQKAHLVVLIGVDKSKVSLYLSMLQKIIKWKKKNERDFFELGTQGVHKDFEQLFG